MENYKHTKGEWEARGNFVYKKNETHCIANSITYDKNNEESMANAKLISAAPDLLEALIEAVEIIKWLDGDDERLDNIKAAIKKATE